MTAQPFQTLRSEAKAEPGPAARHGVGLWRMIGAAVIVYTALRLLVDWAFGGGS